MTLEISFDDLKEEPWLVKNEHSYVQGDGDSCGPIACLKFMEIYGFIEGGSIETIGESAHGYCHVVMDYYNDCVIRFDNVLKVEVRTKTFLHGKQPQSGEDPIKARTVDAHEAAMFMLAVPSPTARVTLLWQLNCDWVTQCCGKRTLPIIAHLDWIVRQDDNVPVLFILNVSWHVRHMPNSPMKRNVLLNFVGNITLNTNTGGKYTGCLL